MLKARQIKIQTPRGERTLTFVQSPKAIAELEVCCEDVCPYGNLCEHIRDPRNPEDQNSNLETQQNKQKSENFITEIKNNKKDKSNNKENQSIESIKTRALSSESEDFISKYLFDSNLKNDNTDNNKININKDINSENIKTINIQNKNCLNDKQKRLKI
jgi:hypothetical protein